MSQGHPYIRPQSPERQLELTNLDKVFWPEGLTKLDLITYYVDLAPVILPYLRDRPLVLKRYPDGITGEAFYQKECPAYAPEWVATLPVYHADSDKTINYVLCNNEATLAWLANQGCIERRATKVNRAGRRLQVGSAGRFFIFGAQFLLFADTKEVCSVARKLVKETKKARLLRLLEERGGVVDLGEAAKVIYGTRSKIAQESLERALGAYRMKDRRFAGIRVRNRRLVCLESDAAPHQPPLV